MGAAQAEMDATAAAMRRLCPEMKDWGVNLFTYTDTFVSRQLSTTLVVLLAAVVFVLLIVGATSRVLSSLVFGVSVRDPATDIAVSGLLFVIAATACVIPAIRASRVDPMAALRLE